MVKLSKGLLVLLEQVIKGQVWRDDQGFWVIASGRGKRNVHLRIIALENKGMVETNPKSNFPAATKLGFERYLEYRYEQDHPVPRQ